MCPVCNGIFLVALAKVLWDKTGCATQLNALVGKLQIKRLIQRATLRGMPNTEKATASPADLPKHLLNG
jgi:hypothetical protein